MRTYLRLGALMLALVVIALWFFGGFNTGRTLTSLPVTVINEQTEKEEVIHEKRFLPGIDFLAIGLAGSAALVATSFAFRKN